MKLMSIYFKWEKFDLMTSTNWKFVYLERGATRARLDYVNGILAMV